MKEQLTQRINGNRFPADVRNQVLKEYNTPALWTGKQAREREAILNEKYKLGTGTLQYWVRGQTGWKQPQSKKKKPHVKAVTLKKKKPTTAIVVQPSVAANNPQREGELLLRSAQRSLDRKRPSELTAFELTTLLALRIFEGKG